MAARTTRSFSDHDKQAFLKDLEEWRRKCVSICAKSPIKSDAYKLATKLMADIDNVAEALTGDRKHFHLKPHTTH